MAGSGSNGIPSNGRPAPLISYDTSNALNGPSNNAPSSSSGLGTPGGGSPDESPSSEGILLGGIPSSGPPIDNSPGDDPANGGSPNPPSGGYPGGNSPGDYFGIPQSNSENPSASAPGRSSGPSADGAGGNNLLGASPPSYGLFDRAVGASYPSKKAEDILSHEIVVPEHDAITTGVTLFPKTGVTSINQPPQTNPATFLTAHSPSELTGSALPTSAPIQVTLVSPAKNGGEITMVSTFDQNLPSAIVSPGRNLAERESRRLHARHDTNTPGGVSSAPSEASSTASATASVDLSPTSGSHRLAGSVAVAGLVALLWSLALVGI